MAVESPAQIAIAGLNPIAIEAGLYARFLGYQVTLFGTDFSIAPKNNSSSTSTPSEESVAFDTLTTPLGRRALEAQGLNISEAINDLTTLESEYVMPLVQSDLLVESCQPSCTEIEIELGESELPEKPDDDVEYDTRIFNLKVVTESGVAAEHTADVFVDCRSHLEATSLGITPKFDSPQKPNPNNSNEDGSWLLTNCDDFYYLGDAIFEPSNPCPFAEGLAQIRGLFRILCDNPGLDLYKN